MKALLGFKAFYFFGFDFVSVSVRFRCICEMALKETTQANKEYDIFGPFWVRFGKFTDPPPPPYLNPCQYKCCSRLRDNVYFEIKVMRFRQTLLFLFFVPYCGAGR